ncbi:hypothetical protein GLOIN_2v229933 [Rhizophagus clarus]|uniref:Uncharacterized protein n=1 Tax=Rhizophagus clarus TaxID=94130 RepID=A0A8H3QV43_9GLOM|nr:hypothetical protein GLOIN_2v229933 [Rhizophagus clarus]
MSVSEANPSKHEILRQRITELEAENAKIKAKKADIKDMYIELLKQIREECTRRDAEKAEFKARIEELEKNRTDTVAENAELRARVVKLEQDIDELKKELESKKKRKFQDKCILIAQVLLGEESMIKYRPPFMQGLELDAFFQKYRIALEVQGAQHQFHSTSWYKDVKKLEDIVNRDRQKRCMCQDNGIFLLEVWYDEKLAIVISERIRKIKEFVYQTSKSFDIL